MRRLLIILAALAALSLPLSAQDRSDRIGAGIGASYPFAGNATLFWEHETAYHNAWDVFAETRMRYQDGLSQVSRLWDSGGFWAAGAAWKPCLWRARNRYGSLRLGTSIGASPTEFQSSLQAGWQQSYALRGGWQFYWQAGVGVTLPKWNGLFHAGCGVGIKMPVSDNLHKRLRP